MKGKCPKCLCSSCQRIDWKMIGRYFCKWGVELWHMMDGLTDLECYGQMVQKFEYAERGSTFEPCFMFQL